MKGREKMLHLDLDLNPKSEKIFKKILNNYKDNHELLVKNIFDYQTGELKKEILNLELDLKSYEKKYNLSTEEFYIRYADGEYDDNTDYMIWAGIYEMSKRSKKKLKELLGD